MLLQAMELLAHRFEAGDHRIWDCPYTLTFSLFAYFFSIDLLARFTLLFHFALSLPPLPSDKLLHRFAPNEPMYRSDLDTPIVIRSIFLPRS